ncbi:MAG: 16S rRNA (cytidine(1402)-2'-O)-methyltransferase [Treponema sp.]|nr:16S rRNA (cytidine(1402)-2'-O)-methyltransferase [Treponema sp.]
MIGTPIGNMGDLSTRAIEALQAADLVACEDTRVTLRILTHFAIKKPLLSCRAQNEGAAAKRVIAELDRGKTAAYTSDAGTPSLSDPGAELVRNVSEAGHTIIPIPGPSAFTTLVSAAGGRDKTVIFEGFLSPKAGRRRSRLRELLDSGWAFVLYESPFRILKLLSDLADLENGRYLCLGREMTKLHEEYIRGGADQILAVLTKKEVQKGEFSLYVSGQNHK